MNICATLTLTMKQIENAPCIHFNFLSSWWNKKNRTQCEQIRQSKGRVQNSN